MTAHSDVEFLSGRLLIAMPGIDDPRFERAVVFLCAHDAEHAIGLAVNRPVDGLTLESLFERIGVEPPLRRLADEAVLMGGPVERERGFVLHTDDYLLDDVSVPVMSGLALTTTKEVLQAMGGDAAPRRAILALGYAGWGPGQLEREVRENVWLVCDPDEALIFDDDHDHKWSRALGKLGVTAAMLSESGGRA
ncbi:MAG: YqgE/AlgH family protein [Caulobacterales bacterium]|nr:YqgE/AlgH family protein [Caulobacterales bacterium]